MTAHPPWIGQVGFLLAVVATVLAVRWIDRRRDRGDRRRERLVLGVPWGTLLVSGIVLAIYLFVQGGLENWYRPVVIPFLSWSYLNPVGILASGFTHSGPGHLTGNLVGTLVFGAIAEYAWGHFPRERGVTVGSSLRTNPYARALLLYPAGVLGVGVLTGVFSLGPTIGFSGVVFALAGFALTRFPIGTALGLLATDAVRLTYSALQNPTVTAETGPGFSSPWWAGISIQGHLLGLLVGVALGLYVFDRHDERPGAFRIWVGTVLFVVGENLWALWWYRGGNEFVLFRGLGLWFVLVLSTLIVVALSASDRRIPTWLTVRRAGASVGAAAVLTGVGWWLAGSPGGSVHVPPPADDVPVVVAGLAVVVAVLAITVAVGGNRPLVENYSRRELAALAVLLPLVFTAVVTVPTNLSTVDDATSPGTATIDVRDYSVTYAEDVENQMVSVVNVSVLGESTSVTTSGVIVISEDRHVWSREISTSRLAFSGRAAVRVGGIGWRDRVVAARRGWSAAGGGAAYKVFLRKGGSDEWRQAYASHRVVADPQLRNRSVALRPTDDGFAVELIGNRSVTVSTNESMNVSATISGNASVIASSPIPRPGESVTLSSIVVENEDDTLFASFNGTRVEVGSKETYN